MEGGGEWKDSGEWRRRGMEARGGGGKGGMERGGGWKGSGGWEYGGGGVRARRGEWKRRRLFQQSAVAVQRFAAVFRKQIQQILHTHLRAGVAADIQHRPTLMKHYRSLAAT